MPHSSPLLIPARWRRGISAPLVALACSLAAPANAGTVSDLPTDNWNALLGKHVAKSGGVDYQGFEKDFPALEAFVKAHGALDLKGTDDRTRKAVYINLYNATMIYNLLKYAKTEKIDVASPKFLAIEINDIDVPGGNIWNGSYKVALGGQQVNLDDIEHNLIRGKAKDALKPLAVATLDPRIHTAVNCAARSCPRVREVAYRTETVDAMLDENMREYLSTEAQFHKIDDDTLKANQIVYWYYEDFETHGKSTGKGGAGGYLAEFLTDAAKDRAWKASHLKTNFNDRGKVSLKLSSAFDFHYDWRVNDIRNFK